MIIGIYIILATTYYLYVGTTYIPTYCGKICAHLTVKYLTVNETWAVFDDFKHHHKTTFEFSLETYQLQFLENIALNVFKDLIKVELVEQVFFNPSKN